MRKLPIRDEIGGEIGVNPAERPILEKKQTVPTERFGNFFKTSLITKIEDKKIKHDQFSILDVLFHQ